MGNNKSNKKTQWDWSKLRQKAMPFCWFGLGVVFVITISNSIANQGNQEWRDILVHFDKSSDAGFLIEQDVEEVILSCYDLYETEIKVGDLDLMEVEEALTDHPYIREAQVYINGAGAMTLNIEQNKAVARVQTLDGRAYYLTTEGEKMPLSDFHVERVPIFSGNIKDNGSNVGTLQTSLLQDLHLLGTFLQDHPFWNALVDQVYVNEEIDFVLIPKLGQQEIVIGDGSELEAKFDRLDLFYKEVVNKVGWNKYKEIDVRFDEQIVCTKK